MPANNVDYAYNELTWCPIEMLDLKHFKEAIISYGLHSLFVKQMLSTWALQNRDTLQVWKGLVSAVLETGQQLQWLLW